MKNHCNYRHQVWSKHTLPIAVLHSWDQKVTGSSHWGQKTLKLSSSSAHPPETEPNLLSRKTKYDLSFTRMLFFHSFMNSDFSSDCQIWLFLFNSFFFLFFQIGYLLRKLLHSLKKVLYCIYSQHVSTNVNDLIVENNS